MLALLYNGCEVTEDDIDSDICSHQWWENGGNSRTTDSSFSSSDSIMSFDSGPSRRNSVGYCNGLSSRKGSDDSMTIVDTLCDKADDKPVRRVQQSLCKQRLVV